MKCVVRPSRVVVVAVVVVAVVVATLSPCAGARNVVVRVKETNAFDKAPIAGARVACTVAGDASGTVYSATSNAAKGKAVVRNVPAPSTSVECAVSADGYASDAFTVVPFDDEARAAKQTVKLARTSSPEPSPEPSAEPTPERDDDDDDMSRYCTLYTPDDEEELLHCTIEIGRQPGAARPTIRPATLTMTTFDIVRWHFVGDTTHNVIGTVGPDTCELLDGGTLVGQGSNGTFSRWMRWTQAGTWFYTSSLNQSGVRDCEDEHMLGTVVIGASTTQLHALFVAGVAVALTLLLSL